MKVGWNLTTLETQVSYHETVVRQNSNFKYSLINW